MRRMHFNHPLARRQLIEQGICYTLRQVVVPASWPPECEVLIVGPALKATRTFVAAVTLPPGDDDLRLLEEHVAQSGFPTVEAWVEAAVGLTGIGPHALFRVKLE